MVQEHSVNESNLCLSFGKSNNKTFSITKLNRDESVVKKGRGFARPVRRESILDRQLEHIKLVDKSKVPYQTFFENYSDSDSSAEGNNFSPKQKNKYIRLMSQNYQVTQLQVMNDYLSGLKQKAQNINEMMEANQQPNAGDQSPSKRISPLGKFGKQTQLINLQKAN